jgi:hypothetical protein
MTRTDRGVLHERVCFKRNRSLVVGLFLIALIEALLGVLSYSRYRPVPRSTNFELVALPIVLVFFLWVAIAMRCAAERIVLNLFALNIALELVIRGLLRSRYLPRLFQYYRPLSLIIWVATTLVCAAVLVKSLRR